MNLIETIRDKLKEVDYNYDKDIYFIFMYVSNVYTGLITKDQVIAYTDKKIELPSNDDLFLEGYIFNEDIQINIDKEDGIFVLIQNDIDKLNLDKIEEDMFLLTDNKIYDETVGTDYVKLKQGKKNVIVPKTFSNKEVINGLTLKVVNYIDYDKNNFPYVKYVRFTGFDTYKERN